LTVTDTPAVEYGSGFPVALCWEFANCEPKIENSVPGLPVV
jgi:hypothetical protein